MLIEKEAILKIFEVAKEKANSLKDELYLDGVMAVIDTTPTVDAVPVVRCEECKNRDSNDCPFLENDGSGIYTPLEIKFCGIGERKDGAE